MTEQVPVLLVMVYMAGLTELAGTVHGPLAVKATGRPEVALAVTVNVSFFFAY